MTLGCPPRTVSRRRTCVGCRWTGPSDALLRVVALDGGLTPDPAAVLPGRGAWVHPDPRCLDQAARRRAWSRALRTGPLDDTRLRAHVGSSGDGPAPV